MNDNESSRTAFNRLFWRNLRDILRTHGGVAMTHTITMPPFAHGMAATYVVESDAVAAKLEQARDLINKAIGLWHMAPHSLERVQACELMDEAQGLILEAIALEGGK